MKHFWFLAHSDCLIFLKTKFWIFLRSSGGSTIEKDYGLSGFISTLYRCSSWYSSSKLFNLWCLADLKCPAKSSEHEFSFSDHLKNTKKDSVWYWEFPTNFSEAWVSSLLGHIKLQNLLECSIENGFFCLNNAQSIETTEANRFSRVEGTTHNQLSYTNCENRVDLVSK